MKLAFDTSALVASLVEPHPHHRRMRPWTRAVAAADVEAGISWHAVAETWSILTRLPGTLRLAPASAGLVVDRMIERFTPAELSGEIYRGAMRRCAEKGVRSGALFDALHLIMAEEAGAAGFVTFNEADFERLRGERSPRILVPPDPPPSSPAGSSHPRADPASPFALAQGWLQPTPARSILRALRRESLTSDRRFGSHTIDRGVPTVFAVDAA